MTPNLRQSERDFNAPALLGVESGAIRDRSKLNFSTPQRVNEKGAARALFREWIDCGKHILPLIRDPLHDAADAIVGPVDGHAGKTLPILPASAGEVFACAPRPLAEEKRKEKNHGERRRALSTTIRRENPLSRGAAARRTAYAAILTSRRPWENGPKSLTMTVTSPAPGIPQ